MTRAALLASMAGLVVAAAWAMSPLTLVFGGATIWLCAWCVAGLEGRERVHVARILTIAVGLRFLAIALTLIATRPDREPFLSLFPDARFILDRSLWIRNLWLGVAIGPHQSIAVFDPYAASSFPYLLAALQTIAGPSPYALSLLSVCAFTAGALLIHRMVREAFGVPSSTLALAAIMLWPTLFAWSITVLRESFQFFLGAVVAAGAYYVACGSGIARRAAWAAALIGALAALPTLREGALEIALLAIALALASRAVAARASIVLLLVVVGAVAAARFETRIASAVQLAANRHIGFVTTNGQSFRLLDESYYQKGTEALGQLTPREMAGFLGRSAIAFVTVPAPWATASPSELALVPEQLAWYGAILLAALGAVAGFHRAPWLTSLLAAYAIAGLIIIAPNSGNVGTLVRHRDTIVPFVLALAAAGCISLIYRPGPSQAGFGRAGQR